MGRVQLVKNPVEYEFELLFIVAKKKKIVQLLFRLEQ